MTRFKTSWLIKKIICDYTTRRRPRGRASVSLEAPTLLGLHHHHSSSSTSTHSNTHLTRVTSPRAPSREQRLVWRHLRQEKQKLDEGKNSGSHLQVSQLLVHRSDVSEEAAASLSETGEDQRALLLLQRLTFWLFVFRINRCWARTHMHTKTERSTDLTIEKKKWCHWQVKSVNPVSRGIISLMV